MNEKELRTQYVDMAESYLGTKQGSGKYDEILEAYNSYLPHPRGYVMESGKPWCAAFVSAIAVMCDDTDIIPVECSCNEQIKLFKKFGRWEERDDYIPSPGDIIYYDWGDSGKGDNTGEADHVGIVVSAYDDDILAIEGNKGKDHVVGHRHVNVDGVYIRGFGLPDYAAKAGTTCQPDLPILQYGMTGEAVRSLQVLLDYRANAGLTVDGSFGPATLKAVKAFQEVVGIAVDGSVGPITWGRLING